MIRAIVTRGLGAWTAIKYIVTHGFTAGTVVVGPARTISIIDANPYALDAIIADARTFGAVDGNPRQLEAIP